MVHAGQRYTRHQQGRGLASEHGDFVVGWTLNNGLDHCCSIVAQDQRSPSVSLSPVPLWVAGDGTARENVKASAPAKRS